MYRKYTRTNIAKMRNVRPDETKKSIMNISQSGISVSSPDQNLSEEEFLKGKIARNPENHDDKWYIAKNYFDNNFTELRDIPSGIGATIV